MNTKHLQNLLKKDVTRKEFLQATLAGILGIIGLTAFIKNIDKFAQDQTNSKTASSGYGRSPYGR